MVVLLSIPDLTGIAELQHGTTCAASSFLFDAMLADDKPA